MPYCCIVVPLYAVSTALLGTRVLCTGKPSAFSFVGYILLKMRSGRMFHDAPVSTFTFRVAGMCGLSSSVVLIIAKISSRVSPLSLLTLRMFHQVTVSQCGCDPLLDTPAVAVLVICAVAIETVVSAPSVALNHIAVFLAVEVCRDCRSCGIRFANDSSSHSSYRWIH